MENSLEVSYRMKHNLTCDPGTSVLGIYSNALNNDVQAKTLLIILRLGSNKGVPQEVNGYTVAYADDGISLSVKKK